ncbi:hypothetical protein ID866_9668 [Astraeus odoratus]|nr:hypothetical protein ID866_9668 [Astraeus odoratus]
MEIEFANQATRFSGMDSGSIVGPHIILAKYAHEKYINLDGRLQRDGGICIRGGFAVVYKGTLLPQGIEVAVKAIRGTLPNSEKALKEAIREIQNWSKLRHQNILPLLGITTEFDQTISVVSPWIHKGNAHHYVQDRAIDPRPLIIGISHGLQYLHSHKPYPIFHGDVKGVNVLISPDGQPLLCDFGLSHAVNPSLKMPLSIARGGTLNWMAPELFDDEVASAEADVWAFGMTALELFTAKVPFYGIQGLAPILLRIRMGPPDRPIMEDTLSRLTDEWWKLCCLCWKPDPRSRPSISHISGRFSNNVTGTVTEFTNQGYRVIRISAIEIRNVSDGQSAELTIDRKSYTLSEQGKKGVVRADFHPIVELAVQEEFSLLVKSQGRRCTQTTEIVFDPRDVLSRLQDNKLSEIHGNLRVILEISPSFDPLLLMPTSGGPSLPLSHK